MRGLDDESWVELITPVRTGETQKDVRPVYYVLSQVLPLRKRQAVRDYCQRRFMARKTGPWSADEVNKLRESENNQRRKCQRSLTVFACPAHLRFVRYVPCVGVWS
jgi:hypothetical protein